MKELMSDFRKFIMRGNVLDLAVAVIIGLAFNAVVNSLVNDVIMQIIAAIVGKPNFDDLTFTIGDGVIYYGRFLTALVNFLIIAATVFVIVRAFEELPSRARPGYDLPPLCMVVTDTLLIFDNLRQTLKVVATPYVARPDRAEVAYDRACARIEAIIATLRQPRRPLPTLSPPRIGETRATTVPPSTFEKHEFLAAVEGGRWAGWSA